MRTRPEVSPTNIFSASTRHDKSRRRRKVRIFIHQYEAHHSPSEEARRQFPSALLLALPALTALLITNFAFGIMTRAAPQMNIFALGFPVALMFGLFVIWLTMGYFEEISRTVFVDMFIRMRSLLI